MTETKNEEFKVRRASRKTDWVGNLTTVGKIAASALFTGFCAACGGHIYTSLAKTAAKGGGDFAPTPIRKVV